VTTKAISEEEFKKNLDKNFSFENFPNIALCVSGGVDSIALVYLMRRWIKERKGKLKILHFNHKIRKQSSDDARFVKSLARGLGIESYLFEWEGKIPIKGIMMEARHQRYDKFINFCKNNKIIHLMTAHHSDDCFETYLMRKKRIGTTLGLSSIPIKRTCHDLVILRPLINYRKQRLVATCKYNNMSWVDDFSNVNYVFERPRIRKEISGFDHCKIKNLRNEKKIKKHNNLVLEKQIAKFFLSNSNFYAYGVFEIIKEKFFELKESVGREILKKALVTCSGDIFPPRSKSIKNLYIELLKNKKKINTLHGCMVKSESSYKISFQREIYFTHKYKKDLLVKQGKVFLWDQRFTIISENFDICCKIIDDKVWSEIKNNFKNKKKINCINLDVIKSLPLILCKDEFMIPYLTEPSRMRDKGIVFFFSPAVPLTKKNFF